MWVKCNKIKNHSPQFQITYSLCSTKTNNKRNLLVNSLWSYIQILPSLPKLIKVTLGNYHFKEN